MNWLFLLSLVMLSADCSNFTAWVLWELCWIAVMIFSTRRNTNDVRENASDYRV